MNETTTTKKSEFVFRRLAESFDQFVGDVAAAFAGNVYALALLAMVVAAAAARVAYRYATPAPLPGAKDPVARRPPARVLAPRSSPTCSSASASTTSATACRRRPRRSRWPTPGPNNAVKWYALTAAVFALGAAFVVWMYVRDTRTVRWYVRRAAGAAPHHRVRHPVRRLPAPGDADVGGDEQAVAGGDSARHQPERDRPAWPATRSAPSRARRGSASTSSSTSLTDDKIAFLKNLLEKNPVAVYAFGTRLDEAPALVGQGEPAWSKAEWEAFARYDFKPFVLRGLSDAGKAQLRLRRRSGAATRRAPPTGRWRGSAPEGR